MFGEVFEPWVGGADQVEFLLAAPAFELLLAGDGGADVDERFGVEQASAAVGFGEAFEGSVLVLLDARVEGAGDADVERARGAAHDVGVSGWHGWMLAGDWWVGCDRCHPKRSRRTAMGWGCGGAGSFWAAGVGLGLVGRKG